MYAIRSYYDREEKENELTTLKEKGAGRIEEIVSTLSGYDAEVSSYNFV